MFKRFNLLVVMAIFFSGVCCAGGFDDVASKLAKDLSNQVQQQQPQQPVPPVAPASGTVANEANLPDGDWKQSCNVSTACLKDGIFSVDCANKKGHVKTRLLNYSADCAVGSKVYYVHHRLVCEHSRGSEVNMNDDSHSKHGLPEGNWYQYCNVATAHSDDVMFKAKCRTRSGISLSKFVFYNDCTDRARRIINYDENDESLHCD